MNDFHLETTSARRRLQQLPRDELAALQVTKFNALLARVIPTNRFYAQKFAGLPRAIQRVTDLAEWPFTTKAELTPVAEQGHVIRNLTFPADQYVRFHRTSGTHGRPLVVLDTAADWQWWIETWQFVLDTAGIVATDRVAMAFSFGPFIGFWTANDALVARGALVIPCGGMSSIARLELIFSERATAVCCTPSYALHLASLAAEQGLDLRQSHVRVLIVAGEPGGSVPTIRQRIHEAWGAELIDHAGATEVGPWGFADSTRTGLQVVESEFIAEFLDFQTQRPVAAGELAELILTTLGRAGAPVIRYRTGDLVRPEFDTRSETRGFVRLPGGIVGRADDMMIVRGVNVFPTAIEQILREFPEIQEYRITVERVGELDSLTIEIEDPQQDPSRVSRTLNVRLGLQVDVKVVEPGSLPRFEHKGRRFVDRRKQHVSHRT